MVELQIVGRAVQPHERRPECGTGRELSSVMHGAWLGFARDHTPCVPGGSWEPYEPQRRAVMVFDLVCGLEHDPDAKRRRGVGPRTHYPCCRIRMGLPKGSRTPMSVP